MNEIRKNDSPNLKNSSDSVYNRPKQIKNNFLASSPIREKKHINSADINTKSSNNNITSSDFTKVSFISDTVTPHKPLNQPKKSNSPLNFNHPLTKENPKSTVKQYNLETCESSQIPSMISSVSSSLTNVTQQNTGPAVPSSLKNFNKISVSSVVSTGTHTQIERDYRVIDTDNPDDLILDFL